jgi:hypothetical protein
MDFSLNFLTQHGVRPKFPGTRYFTRNTALTLKNLLLSDHDEPARCGCSHSPFDDDVERCYRSGGAALMGRPLSRSS